MMSSCKIGQGIKVRFIQIWDLEKVKQALGPQTKMVHVESPSNPLMMVTTQDRRPHTLRHHSAMDEK
jgi:cystathionine beta-lyase/cystathionine gamma-synthase